MSDRTSLPGRGLTKWQLALLIGVPLGLAAAVATGGAIYFLAKRRKRGSAGGDGPASGEQPVSAGTKPQTAGSEAGAASAGGRAGAGKEDASKSGTQSTLEQARAIKQQGNELYKQQKYEEAIKCYKEAIQVCPADRKEDIAIFHQNLAAVYAMLASKSTDVDRKMSHHLAVVDNCTWALELNPRYIKALTRRLKAYENIGRKKDALMDVTRVLLLDEDQGKTLSQTVAHLLKDIGQELATENFPKLPPLPPTKHLVRTYLDSFLWSDDLSESKLRKMWLSREVTPPPVQSDQPAAADESHDQQPADQSSAEGQSPDQQQTTDLSEAPQKSYDLTDPLQGFRDQPFVNAAAQFRDGNCMGIIEVLTAAVNEGHAMFVPRALLLRGTMYALWRQDDKALKDLQDVVNTQDLRKEMYVNALLKKAGIFAGQFQMEKCKTCFEKALAIDPNCTDIFIHRARVGLEAEDPQRLAIVVEDLEKAVKMAPTSPYASYSLASTYHRIAGMSQSMQMLESARQKFEDAVKKFPNYVDGLVLYALFLQDLSEFQKAEEVLNKAVTLEPDNPLAHFSLGLLSLVYRQDIEKAISAMDSAISVDDSCVQAYDTLASLELQRGNAARAMDLYDKGIQFSRSMVEMSQAYVAKEIVSAQEKACREYGISPNELANKPFPGVLS